MERKPTRPGLQNHRLHREFYYVHVADQQTLENQQACISPLNQISIFFILLRTNLWFLIQAEIKVSFEHLSHDTQTRINMDGVHNCM